MDQWTCPETIKLEILRFNCDALLFQSALIWLKFVPYEPEVFLKELQSTTDGKFFNFPKERMCDLVAEWL
jgi:hypothetical protein